MTTSLPSRILSLTAAAALLGTAAIPTHSQTLWTPSPSFQAVATSGDSAQRKKAQTKATIKRSTAKVVRGSEESPSERDRRLYRECRGAASGGACLGYTR